MNFSQARGSGSASRCRSGFKTSMLHFIEVSTSSRNRFCGLIAQHPALKFGSIFEIRPAFDMSEIIMASRQRRHAAR